MKKTVSFFYNNPFLLFAFFLFIVYLPVFLPFFHLKNDLINQNLPTRFVISESLYSGYFPWWNPYIHYGIPQYGDMNNGFWNPILWVIAKTVGYSVYTITLEEMFYLLIAGWGMYKLIKELFSKDVALVTGLAYLCCGYAVGHLQHFIWITGVAFFPYILFFFFRTNQNPIVKNYIGFGISVLFFTASTHPGLIIGAAYFFLFILLFIYLFRYSIARTLYTNKFVVKNILLLTVCCICSIVVIVSNFEMLQNISRGTKVSLNESLLSPTTLQSYFSLLFPLPIHKSNFFNTDISMRNIYGGMALLFGLFYYFKTIEKKIILFSLIPLLFFILLASGGWFKIFAWKFLPYTGYVRMNGEFAYFVMLILFILSAAGLHSFLQKKNNIAVLVKPANRLMLLFTISSLISLVIIFTTKSSLLFTNSNSSGKYFIKALFENLSFADLLFIQSVILLLSVWFIKKYKFDFTSSFFILSINLIITTWLCLPYTGLGMKSKKEMQQVINSFPKGIQKQELTTINQTKLIEPENKREYIMLSSFSKKIGSPEKEDYPVQLKSNAEYFADSSLTNFINQQAWLFLSSDTTVNAVTNFDSSIIKVIENGPGKIKCFINSRGYKFLVLLQNNYPHWQVSIDGKKIIHATAFKTFIAVPVPEGNHLIEFIFNPKPVKIAFWINISVLILLAILLSVKTIRNKKLFK